MVPALSGNSIPPNDVGLDGMPGRFRVSVLKTIKEYMLP